MDNNVLTLKELAFNKIVSMSVQLAAEIEQERELMRLHRITYSDTKETNKKEIT